MLISACGTFYGLASAYNSLKDSPDKPTTYTSSYQANLYEKNPSTSTSQTSELKLENVTTSWLPSDSPSYD